MKFIENSKDKSHNKSLLTSPDVDRLATGRDRHLSGTRALSRVFTKAREKNFQGAAEKGRAIV